MGINFNVIIKDIENIKESTTAEFLTLKEYKELAIFHINKYGGQFKLSLLSSDDAVSYIMYALMKADWTYDPHKKTKKTSYRALHVLWTIGKLIRDKYHDKCQTKSDFDTMYSKQTSIDDKIDVRDTIKTLNTIEQLCIINYYFMNKTWKEIGAECGFSRQSAQQIGKQAIIKMKEYLCHS